MTIGHDTHPVPDPFLVMATQNPIESEGTYPLPEAQIDRFMLKVADRLPASTTRSSPSCSGSSSTAPELRAGALARRAEGAAARGLRHLRRPVARELRGRPRDCDARAGRARACRTSRVHLLRRQPARPDQPRAGRESAGADPRARLRRSSRICRRSPRTRSGIGSCSRTRRSPRR